MRRAKLLVVTISSGCLLSIIYLVQMSSLLNLPSARQWKIRVTGEGTSKEATNVLVIGIGRSGTTVIASAIASQDTRSVFYFEPIQRFRNRSETLIAQKIAGLFRCETVLDSKDRRILPMGHWLPWYLRKYSPDPYKGSKNEKLSSSINRECRTSPLRVIKVIKLESLNFITELVKLVPNLRILSVHRDPRAVTASRSKVFKEVDLKSISRDVCKIQENLIEYMHQSAIKQSAQVLEVGYENYVLDTRKTLKQIFSWMNLTLTNSVESFLLSNQHCIRKTSYTNCVGNASAEHLLNKWHRIIPRKLFKSINEHCKPILERYGYA